MKVGVADINDSRYGIVSSEILETYDLHVAISQTYSAFCPEYALQASFDMLNASPPLVVHEFEPFSKLGFCTGCVAQAGAGDTDELVVGRILELVLVLVLEVDPGRVKLS